jgi:phosphoribosylformylglycinamidine synthase
VTLAEAIRPDALLFGEAPGRVVVATADADALLERAAAKGVPARRVGTTGGERLCIASPAGRAWIDTPVAKLHALWENGIPRRLEVA